MKGKLKFYQMLAVVFVLTLTTVTAQDDGFIYGKVTTIDGDEYKGAMRWGKEEAYWTDMFNASKYENENLDFLTREEYESLIDQKRGRYSGHSESRSRWTSASFWDDWDGDDDRFIHQFTCQFGEIKSLRPRSRSRVEVEMQNGNVVMVDGDGYNDIGSKIRIQDSELGTIEMSWSRIDVVEFLPTPAKLDQKFGDPLFGIVESDIGKFTGFIQWDHDERVSTDELDGDTEDGDLAIQFGKIKSIERIGYSRSEVVLNSGRSLELSGSNDVNDENRGIIVTIPNVGRVDIPWKEFDKVTFEKAPDSGPSYAAFKSQNELTGSVSTTNGDTHQGRIIFDLDETHDYEVLQGRDDDSEFIIPFRNIASITPRNYDYSMVKLKNGDELMLGEGQDVSDRNEGILVFADKDPIYIPWEKVKEIILK